MRISLLLVLLAGCTASGQEVEPPLDQFFSLTAAAVSPDDNYLFVSSSNSTLEYDAGVLNVVDLAKVDTMIDAWTNGGQAPDGCAGDSDHVETLICDETRFLVTGAEVMTGNFATDIAVQDRGDGRARLIIPMRGDPSVTWVDWDGAMLSCATDSTTCDDVHRLASIHGDATISDEPFEAYVDSANEFAVVSHFSTGVVTLVDSPRDGDATLADAVAGLFAVDSSGYIGSSGVTGRDGLVYVASQYEDRIQMLTVGRPVNSVPYLIQGPYFFLDAVGGNIGYSANTRSLAYSRTHPLFYDLNRDPPSLQIISTETTETGDQAHKVTAAVDICRKSSQMAVVSSGDDERVYLTCFDDGTIQIVDPRGVPTVERTVSVGRGLYAAVASNLRQRVYVTNFLEDTISVLDADVTSSHYGRVVMRIGKSKPP